MGTWGPGVFADDDAVDVRSDFKHYIAEAQSVEAATEAIAADYGAAFGSPQANTAFWIALALTQWKAGWIDPRATSAALQVIDDGSDLAKWAAGGDARRRAAVLLKAKAQLESTPPPPGPFPAPWPDQLADFRVGEIIGRQLADGRLAVMKVVGFRRTLGLKVRGPAVRLQKWVLPRMPSASEAEALEFLRWPIAPNKIQTFGALVLTAPRKTPLAADLFLRPGYCARLQPGEDRGGYVCVSTWGSFSLDDILSAGIARWWEDPQLSAQAFASWHKPA